MPDSSPPPLAATPDPATKPSWLQTLRVYREPACLRMLSLGFSAGLPLLLVFGTLSFWLREAGIDRTTIGFLSWVGLAYGFKWVWSPLVDRMPIPLLTRALGRRRSWLLASQAVIMLALVCMALTDPQVALSPMVWCAVVVAVASATQDIALDACRIESADTEHQAALAATYQTGYRLAMIWAGAGALWIAAHAEAPAALAGAAAPYQHGPWQTAYLAMALSMLPGVLTVLFSREPVPAPMAAARNLREWLRGALLAPFADFLGRYGWHAALILGLIATYRISDVVMGIMANPFYVDMGFSKDEVAAVTKVFGVLMTLLGALVGGRGATEREAQLQEKAWAVARRLKLERVVDALPGNISGGQKKLLEIGRALMTDPQMLLLDEPMAGVNPTLVNEIGDHLLALQQEGLTILLIEHDMPLIRRLCDEVVVMAAGAFMARGDFDLVAADAQVQEAYLGVVRA